MNAIYRDWRLRALLAVALVGVYFAVWSPLRALTAQHVVAPVIERTAGVVMEPGTHPAVIDVANDDRSWAAPAGIRFLIGVAVLCLAAPRPRYLLAFLAGHLLLGALAAVSLVIWLRSADWGGVVLVLIDDYLIDGLTLAAMALAVTVLRVPLRNSDVPDNHPIPRDESS